MSDLVVKLMRERDEMEMDALAFAEALADERDEARARAARREGRRCECRGRGCGCETAPRVAVVSVMRAGTRINVCERCEMTEDTDSVLLD